MSRVRHSLMEIFGWIPEFSRFAYRLVVIHNGSWQQASRCVNVSRWHVSSFDNIGIVFLNIC